MDADYLMGVDVMGYGDADLYDILGADYEDIYNRGDNHTFDVFGADVTYTDAATVRAVQTALKSKGYDPGKIDGIYGPKTAEAVRNMQAAVDSMSTSGAIDARVLADLDILAPSNRASAAVSRMPSAAPSGGSTALSIPGVPSTEPSFLQKEAFGGMKVYQASLLGVGGLVLIGGLIAALRKK